MTTDLRSPAQARPSRSRRHVIGHLPLWPSALTLALVAVLLLGTVLPSPVRTLVVLPPILTIPGLLTTAALLGPAHSTILLAWPAARAGLAVITSLAWLPAIALVLHVLDAGIHLDSIRAGIGLVSVITGAVAQVRLARAARTVSVKRPSSSSKSRAMTKEQPRGPATLRRTIGPGATVAVAVVVALAATVVTGTALAVYHALPHPEPAGYTMFSLIGPPQEIGRPRTVPAEGLNLPVLLTRESTTPMTYQLSLTVAGQASGDPQQLEVPARGQVRAQVRVPPLPDGCLRRAEIRLSPAAGEPVRTLTAYLRGRGNCPVK